MTRPTLLLLAVPILAAAAADDAVRVTTDTPQYCTQLAQRVAARKSPSVEVQHLLADGRAMCDRGEVRGGILRLRHALVILHHAKPEPAPKDAAPK